MAKDRKILVFLLTIIFYDIYAVGMKNKLVNFL